MSRGRVFVFRIEHICESDAFLLKIMCLQFAQNCLENAHFFYAMHSVDTTHICDPDPFASLWRHRTSLHLRHPLGSLLVSYLASSSISGAETLKYEISVWFHLRRSFIPTLVAIFR